MGRKKKAKRDKIGLVVVFRNSVKVFGPVSIEAPFQQLCSIELEISELLKTEERTNAATHGLLTFKQIQADNLTGSISRNYPLKRPSKLQLNPKERICKQTTSPAALTLHSRPSLCSALSNWSQCAACLFRTRYWRNSSNPGAGFCRSLRKGL